jgi:putative nucleotidyltransferase with HDIG domain
MIPTQQQSYQLWDKYHLPDKKRIHVQLVTDTALFLAGELQKKQRIQINLALLEAGCLLHDIDKAIPRLANEHHPETGVRVLREEGMDDIASLIQFHSVQYIEDLATAPKTWEEKLLFLSDKMVKQEVITVDKRFELWYAETDLPEEQKIMLHRVYPIVKALEKEIFDLIGIFPEDVAQLVADNKRGDI